MTDCKQVFEDTIKEILGSDHKLNPTQWDEIKTLVKSWTDLMEELGASPEDPVYTDALKNANIPFLPSEKRVQHVNTMLDAFLENYIGQLQKSDALTVFRKYRNEQAFVNLQALVNQAGASVLERNTNMKEPGLAKAEGLRDLLTSRTDNTKNWLSLEERMNANFLTYFNQLFFKTVQDKIPEDKLHKLLRNKEFVNDLMSELLRTDDELKSNKFKTQNSHAQIVANAIVDANGQLITQLQRKGARMNMKANEIMPNLNWAKVKAWGKQHGTEMRARFTETLANKLHDEHGSIADKTQYAQDLYDSMEQFGGYIEWSDIHGAIDEPVGNMKVHSQRPMLKLKDGQSWLEINNLFGERDFMGTIVGQFKFMSKTLALTEMFGPEWQMNWDRLARHVATVETGGKTAGGVARIKNSRTYKRAQNTFDRLTASSKVPHNFIESGLRTGRSLMVANKLGSAAITALMDLPVAMTVISRLYGTSSFANIGTLMSGFTDAESRSYARALGTAVEGMMGALQDRFMLYDDWNTMNSVQRGAGNMAHFIMKVSGLEAWTDSMKAGVTSVFRHAMGELVQNGTKFAELDSRFRGTLERFAITEKQWNSFNKTHLDEHGRFDVFKISDLDTRRQITAWYKDAVDTGVITPSLRDAEYSAGLLPPGAPLEEVIKTLLQFKTFPITFTRKILGRAVNTQQGAELMATLGYYMAMSISMGVIVAQMKQITNGKQPYSLDNPKLYEEAMYFASPLGIFQDAIMGAGLSDIVTMMLGKKPKNIDAAAMVAGPLFTEMMKFSGHIKNVSGSGLGKLGLVDNYEYDPDKTFEKSLSKMTQWIMSQAPGQNLWYAKSIYKLALADGLQEMMDPDGYRRRQLNLRKEAEGRMNGELYNPFGAWVHENRINGN